MFQPIMLNAGWRLSILVYDKHLGAECVHIILMYYLDQVSYNCLHILRWILFAILNVKEIHSICPNEIHPSIHRRRKSVKTDKDQWQITIAKQKLG